MSKMIIGYYLLLTVITFFLYGSDKWKARKNLWRIPETTLLGLSFLGGCIGALSGMFLFRHKTQHWKFKILVPLSVLFHAGLWIYITLNV